MANELTDRQGKPAWRPGTCKAAVKGEGRWGWLHPHQCTKPVKADGWCGTHHPDAVAMREKASADRLDRSMDRNRQQWAREAAGRTALDLLPSIPQEHTRGCMEVAEENYDVTTDTPYQCSCWVEKARKILDSVKPKEG